MKKLIIFISLLFGVILGTYIGYNRFFKKVENDAPEIIEDLKLKYNGYGITNKESTIYNKINNDYKRVGTISLNKELELIDDDSKYFNIKNSKYYIDVEDLKPINSLTEKDNRYINYIVFNENIKTKEKTLLYNQDDELIFTIDESFDFPIIIKDTDKYGIEFNDELYYVKVNDVKDTYESKNSSQEKRDNVRTLTYHTVYDPNIEKCTNIETCHPIDQFESHMKYLSENKFLTLTMEELEMFLDKKINIPIKSIAITLDDGVFLDNSIPLIEKYNINATFFIITSKTDVKKYFNSKFARFESHTYDLHNNYKCPPNHSSSQGGQMLCEKHENIVADLKLSQEKLNGSYYFAYPFFDVNDAAIKALKEANFKMAFIGQWDTNGYSTYSTDRFKLRRKTVFGNLSMDGFIDYLV